jgi:chemotaxis protein MotB
LHILRPTMRKRFNKEDEHENTDRWLISYADFLTLIFTFFAALYALSTIDKQKVGVFSTSLRLAFHVIEKPVQGTEDTQQQAASEVTGKLSNVEGISVKSKPRGVVITMANDTAFVSGSADIKDNMTAALESLADVLKKTPGRIVIEGHTDNVTLAGTRYKSNWELATARAASVLHVFIQQGIDPNRFIIAGYGEFRPIESNETAEGRARNRRVEIVFAPATIK